MAETSFTITGELPGLNEYIKALNNHYITGNKMKQQATDLVVWEAKKQPLLKLSPPLHFTFNWYCKNKKKDPDNVIFAKKFIMDGLQKAGVIPQDTWEAVSGFTDNLYLDKENPRIEVVIKKNQK